MRNFIITAQSINSFLLGILVIGGGNFGVVSAQVVTDITSDGTTPTMINPSGNEVAISGGTMRGNNQIHSFGKFDVGGGDIANFQGPPSIKNILSRVTGGDTSQIFGTLKSSIDGANLFLLNPAGVVFGVDAQLDVKGSFFASTADSLIFEDGSTLFGDPNADALNVSVLRMAPPEAFGFLGNPVALGFSPLDPAPLTVSGSTLMVPVGETLSLVGGDITVTGPRFFSQPSLFAPSGEIQLASVGSSGQVNLVDSPNGPKLDVDAFAGLGNIRVDQRALIRTSPASGDPNPGGVIIIRGGTFQIDNQSNILASTSGVLDAPPVVLDINVREDITLNNGSAISATNSGNGEAGAIQIQGESLAIHNQSVINSFYNADGNASPLFVNVNTMTLDGLGKIASENNGLRNLGNGGLIDLQVNEQLVIGPGSTITTSNFRGLGAGANIAIRSPRVVIGGGADRSGIRGITGGSGEASTVILSVGELELGEGGTIDTRSRNVALSGTAPVVGAGDVTIQGLGGEGSVADSVMISGAGSGVLSATEGLGDGGDVLIASKNLTVSDEGLISSSTSGDGDGGAISLHVQDLLITQGSRIEGNTTGLGQGGNVRVQGILTDPSSLANSVIVGQASGETSTTGLFSSAENLGNGGGIEVLASSITLNPGVAVSAQSAGSSDAGVINLLAGQTFLADGSAMTTAASEGVGGDIVINSGGSVALRNGAEVSALSAGLDPKRAQGGTIEIAADNQVTLTNQARVTAESTGVGDAGSVMVTGGSLVRVDASTVSTTAQEGNGGDITLISRDTIFLANGANVSAESFGAGAAGTVQLTAPHIISGSGSTIITAAKEAVGGNILLNATDDVVLSGGAQISALSEGLDPNLAQGGNISIDAGNSVNLASATKVTAESTGAGDAGSVSIVASTVNASGSLVTTAAAQGAGGNILLEGSQNVTLENGAKVSALSAGLDANKARGGNITLRSGGNVALINSAKITAESSGAGDAGRIALFAENTIRLKKSSITTEALQANGGNIDIKTKKLIQVQDSQIISSVKGDKDTGGGDIFLDPDFIVLQNSQILARAFEGNGGNINLVGNVILGDLFTTIDATSELGINGSVNIRAAIQNLSGTIAPLPDTPSNIGTMYSAKCAAQKNGEFSSFAVVDRSGLPRVPGGMLSSPILTLLTSQPASDAQMAQAKDLSTHRGSSYGLQSKPNQFMGC